jgi:hypothetical protein
MLEHAVSAFDPMRDNVHFVAVLVSPSCDEFTGAAVFTADFLNGLTYNERTKSWRMVIARYFHIVALPCGFEYVARQFSVNVAKCGALGAKLKRLLDLV